MEEAVFQHKLLMVNISTNVANMSNYDAARFAWRVNKDKVEEVEYVLAVIKGIIVDAFEPKEWKKALRENFPEFIHPDMPNRYGFVGVDASMDIKELYVDKAVPEKYRKRGASNPVKYNF